MRIDYLYLKNFIGIYNGIGRTELKLELADISDRIILLRGQNGSGKTTVLSMLTPFASSLDNRMKLILPERNGMKEIHYRDGDDRYVIVHNYNWQKRKSTHTVKSYIKCNGEELNPNGNQSSFKQIVKDRFGIDESYFRILRLGNNVTTFIDQKPSDRKKYMSNILPDIDEYLELYGIASDRWSQMRKEIKALNHELDKLGELNDITNRLTSLTQSLNELESLLMTTRNRYNQNLGQLNQLDPDNQLNSEYKKLDTELNRLLVLLEQQEQQLLKLKSEQPYRLTEDIEILLDELDTDTYRNSIEPIRIELVKQSESIRNELQHINELLTLCYNERARRKNRLKTYCATKSLEEYEAELEGLEKQIDEIHKKLDNMNGISYDRFSVSELNRLSEFIGGIVGSLESIASNYSSDLINRCRNEEFNQIDKKFERTQQFKTSLENRINLINQELSGLYSNRKYLDILEQRPEACDIDDCPFIATALRYKDIEKEIDKKEAELNLLTDKLNKITQLLNDYYEPMLELRDELKLLHSRTSSYRDYWDAYELRIHDWSVFLELFRTQQFDRVYSARSKIIASIDAVMLKQSYDQLCLARDKLKQEFSIYQERQKLIEEVTNEIANYEERIRQLKDQQQQKLEEQRVVDAELNRIENVLAKVESYFTLLHETETIRKEALTLKQSMREIKNKLDRIDKIRIQNRELEQQIGTYERQLMTLRTQCDETNYQKRRYEEYRSKLDSYEREYRDIEIVRKALSPTAGIPLVFIENYLERLSVITNKLLAIAYGDLLRIDEFVINEKEFFIRVKKHDGTVMEDVTINSQGETSLISIALSMAMIQESLNRYNILLLDELDSVLDTSNRQAFIDILETQLEVLESEQCFIISHNEVFDNYQLAIISLSEDFRLNDKEYMRNKSLVYKI